jgi:hypothetical protein
MHESRRLRQDALEVHRAAIELQLEHLAHVEAAGDMVLAKRVRQRLAAAARSASESDEGANPRRPRCALRPARPRRPPTRPPPG